MQLLERESPLAALAEYAAEARRGQGRLVLVEREAGVGKSALVERLAQNVPDARWLWGHAMACSRAHPLGLTRRGREVLDLICAGITNAEIAAKLFISAKTVDHHVSAVLAKLGAPSRNAAASQAARLGLVGAAET